MICAAELKRKGNIHVVYRSTKNTTARKLEPHPPPALNIQLYEILREHGFSFDEALSLATQSTAAYLSTSQRFFQFDDAVTIEVSACVARVIYARHGHETPARTSERIELLFNSELEQRAREIRKRREADERRRW